MACISVAAVRLKGDVHLQCRGADTQGSSPDHQDTASQVEAAAAQLDAARRAREAERREGAIQEVEMVLQTYFHNLDNTYNKLATINENMDDVEVRSQDKLRNAMEGITPCEVSSHMVRLASGMSAKLHSSALLHVMSHC